jgi:Bromodomain/TAZ zinc finger
MVTLWLHMKTCRDKNCKTSHCLSSRCVLNHYRICKSQGKTATCEVCGPVMSQIRLQGRDDGSNDPLASSQQPMGDHSGISSLASLMGSQQGASNSSMQAVGNDGQNQQQHAAKAAMMAAAVSQQRRGGSSNLGVMPNGAGSNGSVPSQQDSEQQSQLQQLQQHQMKLQAQLESLKELQKQQQQLLDQQNRLQEQSQLIVDPDSPGAQELQQQQMLLDELQKRCQQQQLRLQQEIEVQANSVSVSQGLQEQTQPQQAQLQQQLQLQQFQQAQQQFQQQQQAVAQNAAEQAQDVAALPSSSSPTDQLSEPDKKKRRSVTEGKARRVGKGERSGKGKSLKLSQARKAAAAEASTKRKSLVVAAQKERVKKPKLPPRSEIPIPSAEDQNSSLVSFMTKENIESHLESLDKKIRMTNRTVTHKCLPIAQQLIDDKFGWVFHDAVDPVALGLPDYFDVVKIPMHLELVRKKLENAIYPSMDLFARDVRLVFENAILYNGEASEVGELAQSMVEKFAVLYKDLVEGM